jgi:protoporphyrinogen/coproporphyrinogen III oxidase
VTLRDGLSSLIDAIAARLPAGSVRLGAVVTGIERRGEAWRVWCEEREAWGVDRETSSDSLADAPPDVPADAPVQSPLPFHAPRPTPLDFDALIVAVPSPVAARLLEPIDSELAADLAKITHSGTAILSLGYDTGQIDRALDGMGAVVPAIEQNPILALSFSSVKYTHRAPEGKVLLRAFVGGARNHQLADMDDAQLRLLVLNALAPLLAIRGEPCFSNLARWPGTMPQYHVGHKDLVSRIEARVARLPNLQLAGNAYHGVGIPDCIHGGELAAERVLAE